jgi:hypothetical protein
MKNINFKIDEARKLLGIAKNATADDARKRYRELAKIWHPDVNSTEEAHEKMQDINKAYALLMEKEFGVLDFWEEANRWWWRRFGNDPIWGNYFPENEGDTQKPRNAGKLIKKTAESR